MNCETWSANLAPISARLGKSRFGPLRQPNPFLLGDRRENADDGILENPTAIEILLGEAPKSHPVGREPVQVLESFENAFAREPVAKVGMSGGTSPLLVRPCTETRFRTLHQTS